MIIAALHDYYQRLSEQEKVSPKGFSKAKISYALVLTEDGEVVDLQDIRDIRGKKPRPKLLAVPTATKRAVNIAPSFLWDNTSYVLGVTGEEKKKKRAHALHTAFVQKTLEIIGDADDEGLVALRNFLQSWSPDKFHQLPPFNANEDILDTNVVFKLDGDAQQYLHERPACKELWLRQERGTSVRGICLVTGEDASLARLHPPIKGVAGAQPTGGNIVSFNNESFISFAKTQSYNAPVSEEVADQYTKALNYLLRRENKRSLRIGDATTVFWARADDHAGADSSEDFLSALLNPPSDVQESTALQATLDAVAAGRPLQDLKLKVDPSTQIFVLGLSPNAGRLSVRFWQTGRLDFFVEKIAQHYKDLELKPAAWKTPPSVWRLVTETAPSRKGKHDSKDVSPHLAGEIMRAIITGRVYPYSMLTSIVMRMRTDGDISGLRVALCKAVIARLHRKLNKEKIPVALDKNEKNVGYLLGRLFAEFENAQGQAIKGSGTSVTSQYYGSASATPAATFPTLFRKYQHHQAKLGKEDSSKGIAVSIDRRVGEIISALETEFPKTLGIEDQGKFAIGYYQQRAQRFRKKEDSETDMREYQQAS